MASEGLPRPRESTTLLPRFLKDYVSSEKTTPIKPTHSIPLVIRLNGQIPLIDFTVQLGHYHSFPVLAIGGPSALLSHLLLQCGPPNPACSHTSLITFVFFTYWCTLKNDQEEPLSSPTPATDQYLALKAQKNFFLFSNLDEYNRNKRPLQKPWACENRIDYSNPY